MTTYGTIPTSSSTNLDYISRAKARVHSSLSTRRPWAQLFDYRAISLPSSLNDSFQRVKTNLTFFATNYALVSLGILFVSLLWHPVSLIVLILMMAAWLFFYFLRDEPLVVFKRVIDERIVIVVLSVFTLFFLFLTSATWNILSSVFVAVVLVLVHAVFMKTDDLEFDEEGYAGIPSTSST